MIVNNNNFNEKLSRYEKIREGAFKAYAGNFISRVQLFELLKKSKEELVINS